MTTRALGRRAVLAGGLTSVAVVSSAMASGAWPSLVSRAFAQARVPPDATLAGLAAAYRNAQRARRPLLVLVIPEDNDARWQRGAALGATLTHGSDEVMVAIGLAEVVCAPMAALRELVPQAPAGEPIFVLIDPSVVPAVVSGLGTEIPPEPAPDYSGPDSPTAYHAALDAHVDAMIAHVSELVLAGLGARVRALSARDRLQARRRAIQLYRAERVAGSYWATSAGCGVHVEGATQQIIIGCGMGHTPERARRFLYFFSPAGED